MNPTITIQTEGGEFDAYVARPVKPSAPVVVVLHEVFGVNEDIRQTCRELADEGFVAIAPDLFWRQERRVDLSTWSDAEWRKGLHYDATAAALANGRTAAFLTKALT